MIGVHRSTPVLAAVPSCPMFLSVTIVLEVFRFSLSHLNDIL